MKELNKECQKIKATLKSAQADGHSLLTAFQNDPKYEWGRGKMQESLQGAMKVDQSEFDNDFMMHNFSVLQKRYGVDFLTSELENFKNKNEKVDKLAALVSKLLRMHATSQDEA